MGFCIRHCTGLSKHLCTLPHKTHCDFKATTVITEQAQQSSNFPMLQELLPASCPQAFPAQHQSLHLKHRFCHRICSSYRDNYSTATIPLEPHLALTQKQKHQPHPRALHSVGAAGTQSLPRSTWPLRASGEAATPPAAKTPAGFSAVATGLGQLSPS